MVSQYVARRRIGTQGEELYNFVSISSTRITPRPLEPLLRNPKTGHDILITATNALMSSAAGMLRSRAVRSHDEGRT